MQIWGQSVPSEGAAPVHRSGGEDLGAEEKQHQAVGLDRREDGVWKVVWLGVWLCGQRAGHRPGTGSRGRPCGVGRRNVI